ncbi:hypothetical protein KC19_7G000600 [Ceratodon purpureus]|uniref:Uncharacterized protein n=1 Tax=Ceratodon purpureus TaxID=3225 RepID=A0A8T0H5M4_CERPU|nr:hypothetical protein KC19_7G000600 [Ceratodon purpureus]
MQVGMWELWKCCSYQIELLEQAKKENIIVYLETGCGKTHIAVMLLQHIAPVIRKPSTKVAVFLCPTVYLVRQQAKVIRRCTDLKVGTYYGEMNVDAWKFETWETELEKIEVFVMTPAILLQNLHHCFMRMDCIELLIFDECHHADKRHPYACIMQEFYHPRSKDESYKLPRILGMTASPIDGKVDRQGQNIERELDKLERMLHAKLHTVKERSELDVVVPRPIHELEYYEVTKTTNSISQQFAQLLSNLKDEYIRNLVGTSMYDRGMLGDACTNTERKMVKNIEKLYNSLHYCATELGIRCAYEAVVLLLRKYDSNCDTEIDGIGERKEVFLQNAFTTLNSLLSQECKSSPCAAFGEVADTIHVSSKVQVLISILERYRDTENMRCIIFVERKIATRVLASLLGSIEVLSSRLRFQPLAGKSAGLNVMNRKLQQHVVESFRDGKVNVLVSTNVAEEGLDIQSCHLVIRFDLPKTPCSFIQSRGRARCLRSTIIYLVERDNNDHAELLQQFKFSEDSMKEQVLSRIGSVEDVRAPDITTIETFQVESTGATISTLCSVSLLHYYCARLAHDSFYTPMPEFSYSTGSWGVKCTVTLPTDALVQMVEGRPTSSPADAKRIACLHACQCLYEAGALTDLLLLKSDENEHLLDSTTAPESSPTAKEKIPYPLHSTIVPDAFSGTWLPGLASIDLHAYTVTFVATPNDRAYVNFGLFLEADLGPEAGAIEVELQLTNRRLVNAKCSPCGTISFEPNQLRSARLFQERVFSAVLDQKPGSKLSGEWSPSRLYLLLPLKEDHELSSPHIDWNCIENLISDVVYDEVPLEIPGSSFVRLCDGYVSINHVINSVVQTVHNGCLYCARELIPKLTAGSPMALKDPRYSSYSDYYEQKHKTTLKFVNQPMLKAKPLIQVHNLLTQRTTSERPAAEEQKAEALVELPLELCRIRVNGLSCGLINGVSLLPSFMHRLEGLLLAIQLRRKLPVFHPDVPADLMLEAITTSKCQESFSLEGLELLGDAFLEVSVSERLFLLYNRLQEGKLSKLRTSIICNTTLERLGRERGLMGYIRDTQFSPKDWAAPGRVNESCLEAIEAEEIQMYPRNRLKRTRHTGTALQGKTIADVFEALIGAHYIHGGVDAAQAMMGWLGCEVGVDSGVREDARTRSHGQLEILPDSKVAELEALLKYKFQNRGLLVEALTHASCPRRSGDCYQRLEFLGDAVLDFLITRHFYESSAKVKRDPGLLTDLRSAAVNNECFARVAVRHNLHMYLLHNSRELAASVEGYVKFVHDSTVEAQCHGWKGDGSPKVLSDLVESLAGAVFLDSNFDLDTVWNVFKQILRPLVTPETLRLEPIRELRELCQHEKFGELKFNKERGVKGDFLMTVTVQVKNETISEVARKPDKKSAKKVVAIQALAALKKRGYEHFSRRLLERKALYAQKFSDLVDVPEEGCHPLATVEKPSATLQSGVQQAVDTFASAGKFGPAPASTDKKVPNPARHCITDRSSSGAAEKPIDRCFETQLAPCTMSSTTLVQELQPNLQCGVDDPQKADRENALAVGTHPQGRSIELMSTTESESSYTAIPDMGVQPRKPESNSLVSHPRNPQHEVVRNEAPVHKNPKWNENNDFEKLCLAYKASLNQRQNFVFDYVRPQGQALTREFDVSMSHSTSTPATTSTLTTASMTQTQTHVMSLPEVAPSLEIQSECSVAVPLVEPFVSTSEGLLKHNHSDAQTTCAATDSVGISNRVYTEVGSETIQVLSLAGNGHHMSSGKQTDWCVSDAFLMDFDVPSADHQDASAQELVSSAMMSAAEPLSTSRPQQLDSPRVVPGQAQPRSAPETSWQMTKGEARSLLNIICMKYRWQDPVYTLIWKGGVSHAPLFIYRVQSTISLGGQAFEIDVEGEAARDVKGAKDSAAARLLTWFQEQGVPIS